MNKPTRRPPQPPVRRRVTQGPPPSTAGQQASRRRSPLDFPPVVEPKFKVLGTGVDRLLLMQKAQPLEMVVIQGYTREIEDVAGKFPRPDEFWVKHANLIETARKLDEILASVQARTGGK